jgi:hypothetical protein
MQRPEREALGVSTQQGARQARSRDQRCFASGAPVRGQQREPKEQEEPSAQPAVS